MLMHDLYRIPGPIAADIELLTYHHAKINLTEPPVQFLLSLNKYLQEHYTNGPHGLQYGG